MRILLETRNLKKSFGGLIAVNDVSFTLQEGTIKGIIGPNGAGKSTLFNLIAGRIQADEGYVFFDGSDITGMKTWKIAAAGMASTFQTSRLFNHLSVLENVKAGRHSRTSCSFLACMLSLPGARKEEKKTEADALAILEDLGLADLKNEEAGNLAFGKQRLVEFARALALEPRLMLLDEPAAGLNITETEQLSDLILKIRDSGITILLVEHDMSLVMNICEEILVLDRGRRLTEGTPQQIQANKDVISIYLGEDDA
ncbi:MAG: ABC transporter ATP-binding protein [Spirochaetales bacterium]|nr:ABC transporter ATP-binding protein [Spirochaetales bacterium]